MYCITSSWWGHTIRSREMRSFDGDHMVWPHPWDVIQYTRSHYFYNDMFIIYFFPTLFWFYKLFWSLIQKKFGNVCHYVSFLEITSSCFPFLLVHTWNLLYTTLQQKQVIDVSPVLKDRDRESENLSSLIGFLYQMAFKQTVQTLYHL